MTDKTIQQGEKVNYTDADGYQHGARVDYVWERSDGNPNPLVNLSFVHDGDDGRTVATSVPYRDEVRGASGYYWERRAPKTHYVEIDADPGDFLQVTNTKTDYVATYRVSAEYAEMERWERLPDACRRLPLDPEFPKLVNYENASDFELAVRDWAKVRGVAPAPA